ncbi:hypothetical protein [Fulvivirga imtechensis]|nr:hypothetical protein [Fulvivirga imtechensis]
MKRLIFAFGIIIGGLGFTACADESEEITPDFLDTHEQLDTGEEDPPVIPPRD